MRIGATHCRWTGRGLALALAICVTAWAGPSHAAPKIYLMRGLANVFSTGIDDLADKLSRRGYATTVVNHAFVDGLAAQAIRAYKSDGGQPVVLIGHSLGADACATMAQQLRDAGVPVALIVALGPAYPQTVPSNVAKAVTYNQSTSSFNATFRQGPGFRGSLRNVDLAKATSIDHWNIDKSEQLHAQAIAMVQAISAKPAAPAAAPASDAKRAADPAPIAKARWNVDVGDSLDIGRRVQRLEQTRALEVGAYHLGNVAPHRS